MPISAANIEPAKRYAPVEADTPYSYFDNTECKAYSLLVYDVIAKASTKGEELGTAEIKQRLGTRYSERFALLDVIDFLGTVTATQRGSRQVFSIRDRFIKGVDYKRWRKKTR